MSLASMTGFARTEGSEAGAAWVWELRSVNGRGFELRLRLPPGLDALEPAMRDRASRVLRRGNVHATLTIRRDDQPKITLDRELLTQLLRLVTELAQRIPDAPPPRPESLLALPGVLRAAAPEESASPALLERLQAGFDAALEALAASRQDEGTRLRRLIAAQVDAIAALRGRAAMLAAEQPERHRARMLESLNALLRDGHGLPEERIAQEVALLATRSDVQEELDRLGAHVDAARALLEEGTAIGRRLDFLVQEFVRETNTLCSKSASTELTAAGLQLKAVIEQMREQVQNVE